MNNYKKENIMDLKEQHEKKYQAWLKEENEPYYYNLVHGEMQEWQKDGYTPVNHPTAIEATSFSTKTKKFLKKLFA